MSQFAVKFGLPPVGVSDVAQRELTVTVNGGDPPLMRSYDGQPLETDEWEFAQDSVLNVSLVDIDSSGNRSQPSASFNVTINDDVPPPQPGELNLLSKRQL